jgi:hypothetical protein
MSVVKLFTYSEQEQNYLNLKLKQPESLMKIYSKSNSLGSDQPFKLVKFLLQHL